MMWYRALSAHLSSHLKNNSVVGKKQPVQSLRALASHHFHPFYYTAGIFGNWNYVVMLNVASSTLTPVSLHPIYTFTHTLPLRCMDYLPSHQTLTFFSHFFWKARYVVYPYSQTWKDTVIRNWWGIATCKTYLRLRFRGKGYYLYKSKRNSLSFRFGFSHRVYRYPGAVWYRLLSKTEIFIWGHSFYPIWVFAWSIKGIRPHNQYTGKGIRFSRQITYKKLGKVGSYR